MNEWVNGLSSMLISLLNECCRYFHDIDSLAATGLKGRALSIFNALDLDSPQFLGQEIIFTVTQLDLWLQNYRSDTYIEDIFRISRSIASDPHSIFTQNQG